MKSPSILALRKIKAISDYQFGTDITDILFNKEETLTIERSKKPCTEKSVNMWSKKGMPVELRQSPLPSIFSLRLICVSFVLRTTSDDRAMSIPLLFCSFVLYHGPPSQALISAACTLGGICLISSATAPFAPWRNRNARPYFCESACTSPLWTICLKICTPAVLRMCFRPHIWTWCRIRNNYDNPAWYVLLNRVPICSDFSATRYYLSLLCTLWRCSSGQRLAIGPAFALPSGRLDATKI